MNKPIETIMLMNRYDDMNDYNEILNHLLSSIKVNNRFEFLNGLINTYKSMDNNYKGIDNYLDYHHSFEEEIGVLKKKIGEIRKEKIDMILKKSND